MKLTRKPGMAAQMARIALGGLPMGIVPQTTRSWLVSVGYQGAFQSTDPLNKDLQGWNPRNATADQTLVWNLTNIIAQCRQLERENPTARGAIEGWKADVIGTGIGVEPDTGDPDLNRAIRWDWLRWCENCTPEGNTLWELQSQAMGEWCTAGAHLWREMVLPERADQGLPPIVFAPLEVEWMTLYPIQPIGKDNNYVRGVESDQIGRALKYHLMDYNLLNQLGIGTAYGGPGYVVSADKIIHGFEKRRPRQTHGEPLLAIGITRLKQEEQLVSIELKASKNTAAIANVITSDMHPDNTDQFGNYIDQIPAGSTVHLMPGDEIHTVQNNRPTAAISPFRDVLRGDLAAALRTSQQYLDRNSARANYSSSRMDELITERLRGQVQQSMARSAASEPYRRVLPWILMRLGMAIPADPIKREKLFRHKTMPDRPKYVDPEKDGNAADTAIRNGRSTLQQECASIGRDYEQIRAQRIQEQIDQDMAMVNRITAIHAQVTKAKAANPGLVLDWSQVMAVGGAESAPGAFLEGVAAAGAPTPSASAPAPGKNGADNAA